MCVITIEALGENAPHPGLKNYIVLAEVRHAYQAGREILMELRYLCYFVAVARGARSLRSSALGHWLHWTKY
jgi:hypothetical protein